MTKNYARESGTFMALAQMMRDAVNELAVAQNDFDRVWATRNLMMLSEQTTKALVNLGYEQKEVDTV
jgi:Holliday junction resolvasome RuvABC DNA-binding subunit